MDEFPTNVVNIAIIIIFILNDFEQVLLKKKPSWRPKTLVK